MANISKIKLPNDSNTYNIKDTVSGYVATEATTSAKGLMSSADKTKLNGIASGAEVNQNAFSNVVVGTTTIAADSKTDSLTLEGGANITLTPDATNDKITISLDDTVDTGEVIATDVQAGNLIVNGTSRFLNTINGDISGSAATATSATKATQDESGNNIKSTYAASFSISDHTITLKNKNGTSLGTVTVPDNNTTYTVATGTANGKIKVTPSTGNAYEVSVYGLKSAAYKDVTDTYSETGTDPVSGKAVKAAIDGLPSPMVFKGTVGAAAQNPTVTSLPVDGTAVVGDTYKVITNGTYGGKASKVGDTLICLTKTSSANTWEIVPSGDEPSGTVTSVAISNGGGLSVSGSPITSSGTITISHADTSSQASINNSDRTYIQDITLDTYGHVTGITSATETVVNTDRYVNSAAFADATSADASNPVKMTLTRAGSDTASVTAYLPKISSSSAGVVPKGTAVSSQSQSTKFLREDGTWAAPSYTTNTNTTYTLGADTTNNKITLTPSSGTVQSVTVPYATSAGSATDNTKLPLAGGTMTGVPKFATGSISAFSGNIPYILGIEAFADGGAVKWKSSDDVSVGYLTETDYTATDYARHTTGSRFKAVLTRQNKCGIGTSPAGGLLLASNWTLNSFNAELYMGMGDNLCMYYRGVNSNTYTNWYPIGRFTQTTPTTGQVVITDGTTGGIKSSGYTIATSVPSGAVFTDTKNTAGSTDTSSKIYLVGATSQAANPQTYSDDQVYVTNGTLQANVVNASAGVNANTSSSGTSGGLSLYSTDPTAYGVTMRITGTASGFDKHGYVQGDWAGYFNFSGAVNRGWIYRHAGSNVTSISGDGNIVTNGSLTLGGNATNTSGVRQVYNSTTQSLDFVFAS